MQKQKLHSMSDAKKTQAYTIILSLFERKTAINSTDIMNALEDAGLPCSARTVPRYISDLRDLGFEIEYDAQLKKSKLISKENKMQERILNSMVAFDFLKEVSLSPRKTLSYIDFDIRTVTKGVNYLSDIFKAISQSYWIEIEYQRYSQTSIKKHLLAPLFLKEYNNRWYLLAIIHSENKGMKDAPLLFGLDRIVGVTITNNKMEKNLFESLDFYPQYKKDCKTKPIDLFFDTIGAVFSDEPVQKVILSFEPKQAPYISSQPWHHSQEILIDNKEEFKIALYVRPNEELITLILAQCGRVEVVEPKRLRNKVKTILEKAVEMYK